MEFLNGYWLTLLGMALLLFCSAFFSGTETALFSLSRDQVKELRAHGRHVDRLLGGPARKLNDDEKRLFSRMAEVFAGVMPFFAIEILRIALLLGYGVAGMLWLVVRTRRVVRATERERNGT